jgi:hypothetical protein
MSNLVENEQDLTFTKQIIKQQINAWKGQNIAVSKFFNKYPDEVYLNEIAPGRNRAVYLLGHLVAVSDGLMTLLGFGEKLYPELEEIFLKNPDRFFADIPSVADLKQKWETVNIALTAHFESMHPEEWLSGHKRVSAEDFAIDPTRNKLNVLISRTNHQSNHMGQLQLLKEIE